MVCLKIERHQESRLLMAGSSCSGCSSELRRWLLQFLHCHANFWTRIIAVAEERYTKESIWQTSNICHLLEQLKHSHRSGKSAQYHLVNRINLHSISVYIIWCHWKIINSNEHLPLISLICLYNQRQASTLYAWFAPNNLVIETECKKLSYCLCEG